MKLQDLNKNQLKAVQEVKKPLLVFAGAGSGKTRVLTYKIWHLINQKLYQPQQILALTFTNKAAKEMKDRISQSIDIQGVNVGTFHSIGARILRQNISKINDSYGPDFSIYDTNDQKTILREIIEELNLAENRLFSPSFLLSEIDKFKNNLIDEKSASKSAKSFEEKQIAEAYNLYSLKLKKNNAVDFNDLILLPIKIFSLNKTILKSYTDQWKYILVDEFQDTNTAQFKLIALLSNNNKNITVVGDDDQSIYGWRGANIDNILTNFNEEFPNCVQIKLEENYRSSQTILDAAWSVVINNKNRAEKKLRATKGQGEKISLISTDNDEEEANAICDSIKSEIKLHKNTFKDFAVLYRTNAQSRSLEQAFIKEGLPYNIVGGTKFYDRKEIKDIISYLSLITNPNDNIALKRIINFPVRGIGEKSISLFEDLAAKTNISMFQSLKNASELNLRGKQLESINSFWSSINKFNELLDELDAKELIRVVLEEFNIENYYKNNPAEFDRYNNIQEFKAFVDQFMESNPSSLREFLQEISLFTDIDNWDNKNNSITLMTVHAAKGLEFPKVMICGLEQGLFPLIRLDDTSEQLEEERRLFYVAVTRAMENVFIFNARFRRRFGSSLNTTFMQSQFLDEIDSSLVVEKSYKSVYTKRITGVGKNKKVQVSRTIREFDDFRVGDQVEHNLFGVGTILVLTGTGENQKVGVEFSGGLKKKLIVKYARLKKIG
ncbi:MAG: UvrD-helicase domain-containing protein [Pelagibacteraceae bacterium]